MSGVAVISTWLRRLYPWRGGSQRGSLGLSELLGRYVSIEDLQRIIGLTPDRRLLIDAIAEARCMTSSEIVRVWAKERGVPYFERIPAADFTCLPSGVSTALLDASGATVITERGTVVCVVCADIDRVDHLVEKLGTTPRALAPWSEIKRHLHESERVLAEIKTAALRDSLGRLRETTEAVLGIIVHEVSGCGSTRLLLDLSGEDLSYAPFEGGTAEVRGYLHGMLRPGIAEVVREPRVALVLPDGSPCAVTIERESGDERYILGWPEARRSLGGASPTRQGSSPLPHRAPDTTRGSIFVIDDDPTFRDVLRRFLERHRFSVQPFSSADEAWQALQDGAELDLIICDVHMPGMSGYDFIRRLRATSAGRGVPLVALTSASDVDVEIELIEAGVAAFVSKGADPRILCAHVERLCEERSRSEPRCSE